MKYEHILTHFKCYVLRIAESFQYFQGPRKTKGILTLQIKKLFLDNVKLFETYFNPLSAKTKLKFGIKYLIKHACFFMIYIMIADKI